MNVLVGRKQPRIVYLDSSNQASYGFVLSEHGTYTRVESVELTSLTESERLDLVNTCFYATNNVDGTTWTVITAITKESFDIYKIYHNDWSNSIPKVGSTVTSKYYGYELPYCQNNLVERFVPDVVVTKLWNGTKDVWIKGFWYYATLDYSKKVTPETTKAFSRLYDSTRTYNVMLYPRRDNLRTGYQIEINEGSDVTIAQKMNHLGNKFFKASVIGVTRVAQVSLDPTLLKLVTEDGEPITIDSDGNYLLGE